MPACHCGVSPRPSLLRASLSSRLLEVVIQRSFSLTGASLAKLIVSLLSQRSRKLHRANEERLSLKSCVPSTTLLKRLTINRKNSNATIRGYNTFDCGKTIEYSNRLNVEAFCWRSHFRALNSGNQNITACTTTVSVDFMNVCNFLRPSHATNIRGIPLMQAGSR